MTKTHPEPPPMLTEVWKRFSPSLVPPDASYQQRHDMEASFMSGAAAVFAVVESVMKQTDHMSTAKRKREVTTLLDSMRVELEEFAAKLMKDSLLHDMPRAPTSH